VSDEALLVLDPFDVALLELDDWSLLRHLGRPTLARIAGTGDGAPRAVVTLQHGDEPTGLQAVLRALRRRPRLPYDLWVAIGNVRAALEPPGYAHRFLSGQRDMNRLWVDDDGSELGLAVQGIRAHLLDQPLASVVDLHNTSGANPFHAIVAEPTVAAVNLATLFTTTVVRWDQRVGAMMEALHPHAPSIAVECGLAGRPGSLAFALDGVRRWLAAPDPASDRVAIDHDLLVTMRRVLVRPDVRFRFGGEVDAEVDLAIDIDADQRNGVPTAAGWVLGRVRPDLTAPLVVLDPGGSDVTDQVVTVRDGQVVVTIDTVPLMMTRTVDAARKDCLTYLLDTASPATGMPPPASGPATASSTSGSIPANRSSASGEVHTRVATRS
jgi:hypothetical protein